MKTEYVLLRCGMANRLRTIVGFWYIAELKHTKIIFHWDTADEACNGHWLDIFKPICFDISSGSGISVIDSTRRDNIEYIFVGQDTISNIIKIFLPGVKTPSVQDIEDKYYKLFQPRSYLLDRVRNFFTDKEKTNMVAIHVRRSDHIALAKKNNSYTTFEEFDTFISKHKQKRVFLATDELSVQKKYNNCLVYKCIQKTDKLRQTTLANALIDVLIASECSDFKGSRFSSYSNLIDIYRRLRLKA